MMEKNNVVEMNVKKQKLRRINNNAYTMSVSFTNTDDDADVVVGGELNPDQMIAGVAVLIDMITGMLSLQNPQGDLCTDKIEVYENIMDEINGFSRMLVLGDDDDEQP